MNHFQRLVAELERLAAADPSAELEVCPPLRTDGIWEASLSADDGFTVVAQWQARRGFGLVAGMEFESFGGVHESYATSEGAAERITALWTAREATSTDVPVGIADLRKQRGQLQKDIAAQLSITKGGLSQIEASVDVGKVQVDTLGKLANAMGARLVVSFAFPDGTKREVAVGR